MRGIAVTGLISGVLSYEVEDRSILTDVAVDFESSESVAIVGVNGAGKTTLLRLLANVLEPTRGSLSLRGVPYVSVAPRELACSLAYVPQVRPARVPLTVREVVLLGRYPHGSQLDFGYQKDDFEATAAALEVTGLTALANRRLAELSGGERQSVYIAAALAQETECLLLDEPTTYLDPGHQRRIALLLRRLIRQQRRTVIFASHDLNLAYSLADRVIVLADGGVAAAGPTAEVLETSLLERVYRAPFHVHHPPPRSPGAGVGPDRVVNHPIVAVDLDAGPDSEDQR